MSAINSRRRQANRLHITSLALLFAAAAGYASAAERPSSFNESLDYMSDAEAMTSAKTFVATQLPAGLSRTQAVARLDRAGMDCGRTKVANTLNCSDWSSTEEKWTVHVRFDDHGAVSTANVDYERIGVDDH